LFLRANDSKCPPTVEILSAGRSFFTTRYAVCEANGTTLARLCMNHLYGLWRLRWTGHRPDQARFVAVEDSRWFFAEEDSRIPRVVRGMARSALSLLFFTVVLLACVAMVSVLPFGPLGSFLAQIALLVALLAGWTIAFLIRRLRPNFLIAATETGEILGKLEWEQKDRSTRLNLIADQERLDRRVALAVAVLLDRP
jgi:hypothetical protein